MDSIDSMWFAWSPPGVLVKSRWIMHANLLCSQPKKMHLDSAGVHLEYVGKVKSSLYKWQVQYWTRDYFLSTNQVLGIISFLEREFEHYCPSL